MDNTQTTREERQRVARTILDQLGRGFSVMTGAHTFCSTENSRPRHAQFFEEDCEWAAVALAFPILFTDAQIYNAVRTAECWLKIPIPEGAAAIRDKFHAHLVQTGTWERGGCSSAGGDWRVFMRRVADDASRVVLMREYPAQQFYAAEDVEALPVCD